MVTNKKMQILKSVKSIIYSSLLFLLSSCESKSSESEESSYVEFDSIIVIYQGKVDTASLAELVIYNSAAFSTTPRIEKAIAQLPGKPCDSTKNVICLHLDFPRRTPGWKLVIGSKPKNIFESFCDVSTWANDCDQFFVYAYFVDRHRWGFISRTELNQKVQNLGLDSITERLFRAYIDSTDSYSAKTPMGCM